MSFSTTEAGGALKVGSQIGAGRTRAAEDRANESIARDQAESEFESAGYNANLQRQKTRQTVGTQIANIGGNNLQQGGTPSQVVANTAGAGERSALMIQNNALRRAWGFEVQGSSDQFQAEQAEEGGLLSGLGTAIGTAGSLYKMSAS